MPSSSVTPIWQRFGAGLLASFALVGAFLCLVAFLFVRPELDVRPGPAWTPPYLKTPSAFRMKIRRAAPPTATAQEAIAP